MTTPVISGPAPGLASQCIPLLRLLPDWFGLEDEILEYERQVQILPTFTACQGTQTLGFLTLKQHNPFSAEILVMAVHPQAHRQGLGRKLIAAAEEHARQLGLEYMQVKTLGPSRPDENYARTRLFYQSLGYRPLEEFPRLWDEQNPCLLLVKRL